jgi:ABC-type transporter Mla subunit MlaD
MRFDRDDAKIGLLVFIAIAVFLGLVFHRGITAVVKKETIVEVRLQNVSGLEVGTEVQLQGYRVGQVNQIHLKRKGQDYYYVALLGLQPGIVLWKGTTAVIESSGIGSSYLDLNLPPSEKRLAELGPGDTLIGDSGASLGTLITAVQSFIQNLDGSLNDLKAHLKDKGLGAVFEQPGVRKVLLDLDAALLEFRKVAVQGEATLKDGQASVKTLDRGLASLEKSATLVEGLLNRRSKDIDESIGTLASLLKELQTLSTDMDQVLKGSGPEMEASLQSLHRNLLATEELLEILKNKPSRVVWGTPSAAEKEAAHQRAEANRKQEETTPEPTPPPAP